MELLAFPPLLTSHRAQKRAIKGGQNETAETPLGPKARNPESPMNTLYALLLVTAVGGGQEEVQVVDHNLTLEDCLPSLGQRITLPGGGYVTLECKAQREESK